MPRIVKLMRSGDDSLLSGIARIFEEKGITITSVVEDQTDDAVETT